MKQFLNRSKPNPGNAYMVAGFVTRNVVLSARPRCLWPETVKNTKL